MEWNDINDKNDKNYKNKDYKQKIEKKYCMEKRQNMKIKFIKVSKY